MGRKQTRVRTIRLPVELDGKIVFLAMADGRSVNNWIIKVLDNYINEAKKP